MKILVANLGSTSFKYRLLDMNGERQLARGSVERIGSSQSVCRAEVGAERSESTEKIADHAEAVRRALVQLCDKESGCLSDASELAAIGLKAVHGGRYSGVERATDDVVAAMEEMNSVAPAHNPPYVAAIRQLRENLPEIPLVLAFETTFHRTIDERHRYYGVPLGWAEKFQVRRWGFHGASHAYVASRMTQLYHREDLRTISCHLGGSSSVTAIREGASAWTSMGMSPQSGLLQNNRVGEFDPFALPVVMERTGKSLDEVLDDLAERSGLVGVSGSSGDLRDLEQAVKNDDRRAQLAIDVYVASIRNAFGSALVELGGLDVVAFTGGIGENSPNVREAVCDNLIDLGVRLDLSANRVAREESKINDRDSLVDIWIVPANEEIIVARQVKELLEAEKKK
jgi:acetate kinase